MAVLLPRDYAQRLPGALGCGRHVCISDEWECDPERIIAPKELDVGDIQDRGDITKYRNTGMCFNVVVEVHSRDRFAVVKYGIP